MRSGSHRHDGKARLSGQCSLCGKVKASAHIVGQFAQRIVVPQIPAVFLFQPLQPGQNIGTGIGKVVSAQQSGTDGPFQIGKGVAVRLEGTQQECQAHSVWTEIPVHWQAGRKPGAYDCVFAPETLSFVA